MIQRWVKIIPSAYKAHLDEDDDIDDDDTVGTIDGEEGQNDTSIDQEPKSWMFKKRKVSSYRKKASIAEMMEDSSADRDMRISELTKTLSAIFPKLKGDIVTFIGSTFLRYGDEKPYMNHCIVRDTCSEMPHVENAVLESYPTEKEVLLAWTKLIQRENPDIIIGYNIFGFDYGFMYKRCKELGIVH